MIEKLKIKICGMREPANLEAVCELKPDFVGFIFHPGSPRYVGAEPDTALFSIPGKQILRAGVFVNERAEKILDLCRSGYLDVVQLHGSESPSFCRKLKREGIPVIKALRPDIRQAALESYASSLDYFLFDTPGAQYGGSGQKFKWNSLVGLELNHPFFLSGGLAPGDEQAIQNFRHKALYALDVNSGFEIEPGIKDIRKLKVFMEEIKKDDGNV